MHFQPCFGTAAAQIVWYGDRAERFAEGRWGRQRRLMARSDTAYTGDGTVSTHVQYPGTAARVTGQERDVFTSCPVDVAGTATGVLARMGRSLPPFQQPHRNAGTAGPAVPPVCRL
jgi:hypothetical protein